jgi:YVTN family beta-propeller protein
MRYLTIILCVVLLLITPTSALGGGALGKYLWVPNYGDNTVSKVDVNSHTVVVITPVGEKPAGIAVGVDYVYVTCRRSSYLYRISKATNTVHDSIDLSGVMELPIGVAVDPAGYAFVVGREHFDPSVPDPAYLAKVNPQGLIDASISLLTISPASGDEAMWTIGVGLNGKGDGFVPWRRAWDGNTGVIQFNTNDLSFTDYPISADFYRGPGVGIDEYGNGWTAGCRVGTASFTKSVPDSGLRHYSMPESWEQRRGGVVVDTQDHVWASTAVGLFKLVPATEQVYKFAVGVAGGGLACDINGYIWVTFPDSNKLKKFDLLGNQVGQSVEVGNYPLGYGDMTGYECVSPTAVQDEDESREKPSQFTLSQNYPNPFNQATKIEFTLAKSGFVNLNIYDILGRKVRTLVSERLSSGCKSVLWDGKDNSGNDVASGIYFYQLRTEDFSETKKLVLLK